MSMKNQIIFGYLYNRNVLSIESPEFTEIQ